MKHSTAVAVTVVLLAGCSDPPPLPPGHGVVQLAATASDPHDVAQFEFRVIADGTGDCNTGTVVDSSTILINGSTLLADDLFVLPAATYLVCAFPQKGDATPSDECSEASDTAIVNVGQTTGVGLISTCTGGGNGAIDVTVSLEDFTLITDIAVTPSKYFEVCNTVNLAATLDDPGVDGFISTLWSVESSPVASTPTFATPNQLTTSFFTDIIGDYDLELTVIDQLAGTQSLTFPVHALPCDTSNATQWLAGASVGAGDDFVTDVAAAGPNAVAVGAFDGTLDFGAGAMIQPAGMGAYVVKLDSSGAPLWSKNYGTAGFSATATSVAVDSVGDIFVLGDSGSSHVSDLGGTCTGFATPSYLAKLDGATGACIWNVGIDTGASLGVYGPTSVEVDTSGNVVFAVRGDQALEITTTGGVETGAAPAGFGAWLAKRDGATGSAIWTQVIDGAADEHLSDLSISPVDGAVAMAGYTDGTSVTFPGGQNVSFTQVPFGFDGFVAQFDGATGEMTWVNLAQSTDSTFVEALTTTNSGDVVAVWTANGSVDFGGGPITLDGVAIVTYSGLGAYQAARLFPTNGTGTLANPDLAVAPNGEVRMTAGLFGTVDLGTGPIVASTPSQYDVLVFSLDTSTGVVSWHSKSSAVGTAGQFPRIDVAADGATLVGGARPSVLTFGTASLPFNGGPRDSYVVKLAP